MTEAKRTIRQSRYMSDTEAMMWTAERDPWLSSGMGSVFVLDKAPDFDRLLATLRAASLSLLRLRERVVDGSGIAPPKWVIDDEFNIDDHVRHVTLGGSGGMRELLDLTAQTFEDAFDRSRPLWKFVAVSGSGSRRKDAVKGAVILKLHHSVSDGIGAMRLGEMYFDLERDPTPRPDAPEDVPTATGREGIEGVIDDVAFVAKRHVDFTRRTLAEVALWGADPERITKASEHATAVAKTVVSQVVGTRAQNTGGSDLWRDRSRHRHLEVFDSDLEEMKAAAKRRGGSVNDLFVAGTVLGASRFHAERPNETRTFNLSFVLSTRSDEAGGGNSFMPVPFSVTNSSTDADKVFTLVSSAIAAKRVEISSSGTGDSMEIMAAMANLLPASALTKAGRARAARIDWATSNLRGAPFPLFVAGGQVTHMYPVGPLGGTAFNVTTMSYLGNFNFGVFIDPQAVDDPSNLREHLAGAYRDLVTKA